MTFTKLLRPIALLLLLASGAVSGPAAAQVIYDNGPINGSLDAWDITSGLAVSNSFVNNQSAPIDQISFAAWLFPGDTVQSAEVTISSQEFGGTVYFDERLQFMQSACSANQYGFDVCIETSQEFSAFVPQGTFWLTLQGAIANGSGHVYWDENDGPSMASQNSVGTIPSEAFTVKAEPEGVPEPDSIVLFGSGVLVALGALRRRL